MYLDIARVNSTSGEPLPEQERDFTIVIVECVVVLLVIVLVCLMYFCDWLLKILSYEQGVCAALADDFLCCCACCFRPFVKETKKQQKQQKQQQ